MKACFLILALYCFAGKCFCQSSRQFNREGVKLYSEEKFKESELSFKKALKSNPDFIESSYNIGLTYYRQEDYLQAIKFFKTTLTKTEDKAILANLHHNLGNSFLQLNQFKESIDAYKNSLRLNPKDEDTRYNLTIAQLKLKARQKNQSETKDLLNKMEQEEKNSQQFMRRNKNLGREVKNW